MTGRGRTILRRTGWILGALLAAASVLAAYVHFAPPPRHPVSSLRSGPVAVTPERLARGGAIFRMRCADCHVDPITGRASGRRMDEVAPALGVSHSANITRDRNSGIGAWTDGELAYVLRTGIGHDGRLLAPWMPRLTRMSDEDLDSLIAFLRSDAPALRPSRVRSPGMRWSLIGEALLRFAWHPSDPPADPIVTPAVTDRVAYGKYVVQALAECWVCHSGEFKDLDRDHPERTEGYLAGGTPLHDAAGSLVVSANITPDVEAGIGRWSERDLTRALREGVRPDGGRLRYPMPRYVGLDDAEIAAVYAYLRSVPPVRKRIARAADAASGARTGRALYERYGCRACHGDDGIGVADLRQASAHFPTDEALEAWIRHPSRVRPGTRMPDFDGVIRDEDFPPLMQYVRSLGAASR